MQGSHPIPVVIISLPTDRPEGQVVHLNGLHAVLILPTQGPMITITVDLIHLKVSICRLEVDMVLVETKYLRILVRTVITVDKELKLLVHFHILLAMHLPLFWVVRLLPK